MAMLKNLPKYSTKNIGPWETRADGTCFASVEASTLCEGRGLKFGRVYDDACDEGIILVSHETSVEKTFALVDIDHDRSGEDVEGWRFECVNPQFTHLRLLIIND